MESINKTEFPHKELTKLASQQESESNWSTINNLILKLTEHNYTQQEMLTLTEHRDFIMQCMKSQRSKLSISTFKLSLKLLEVILLLDLDTEQSNTVFSLYECICVGAFKLCGKASRIISDKGIEIMKKAAINKKFFENKKTAQHINNNYKSINKKVRLGAVTAICEFYRQNQESEFYAKHYSLIIKTASKDAMSEIRTECKNLITNFNNNLNNNLSINLNNKESPVIVNNATLRKEPSVNFPFLRKPVRNVQPNTVSNTVNNKNINTVSNKNNKKLTKTIINTENSPLRKNLKNFTKINNKQLEEELKTGTPTKSEDELFTPRTLNKFLDKYKKISIKNLKFEKVEEKEITADNIKYEGEVEAVDISKLLNVSELLNCENLENLEKIGDVKTLEALKFDSRNINTVNINSKPNTEIKEENKIIEEKPFEKLNEEIQEEVHAEETNIVEEEKIEEEIHAENIVEEENSEVEVNAENIEEVEVNENKISEEVNAKENSEENIDAEINEDKISEEEINAKENSEDNINAENNEDKISEEESINAENITENKINEDEKIKEKNNSVIFKSEEILTSDNKSFLINGSVVIDSSNSTDKNIGGEKRFITNLDSSSEKSLSINKLNDSIDELSLKSETEKSFFSKFEETAELISEESKLYDEKDFSLIEDDVSVNKKTSDK